MQIEIRSIKDIRPYEHNPRSNDGAVDAVAASIKEFGWQQPIVVDKDGVIIAGHTRYKAAKKLGLKEVPVVVAENLTEEQVRAYRLADNKTGELAEWDFSALEEELAGIGKLDMSQFGFEDVSNSGVETVSDIEEDNYIVELPDEPKAKLGDVYSLGSHRLMCGDSTCLSDVEKLMDGILADLVVTDPPYNMGYEGAGNSKNRKAKRILNDKMPEAEFRDFLTSVYGNYFCCMKDGASIYVFYKEMGTGVFITSMADAGLTYKQELVWVKNQLVLGGSKYQSMYEPFLLGCKGKKIATWNGKRKERSVIESVDLMDEEALRETIISLLDCIPSDVVRENKQLVNDLHPTMKPVRLIGKLILNSSNKGDAVLDLFAGSGTTLIASEQLKRSAYLMELDPRYVDVIIDRWEKLTGGKAVLLNGTDCAGARKDSPCEGDYPNNQ